MSNHDQDQLEYNDGIGDLLRNKDTRKFSWIKTSITLVLFIIGVFATLNFLFSFGKSAVTESKTDIPAIAQEPIQEDSAQVEQKNEEASPEMTPPVVPAQEPVKEVAKEIVKKEVVKEPPKVVVKEVAKPSPKEVAKSVKPAQASSQVAKVKFKVISGSFDTPAEAKVQKENLAKKGYPSFTKTVVDNGKTVYQIQSGAFSSKTKATRLKKELEKKGFTSLIISE